MNLTATIIIRMNGLISIEAALVVAVVFAFVTTTSTNAFAPIVGVQQHQPTRGIRLLSSSTTSASTASTSQSNNVDELKRNVDELKKVLQREYTSFFDPMEREYYSPSVTFDDPLTSLEGVDSYQRNVDMLSSRTLLGKVLFQDAGIVLHSVEGGEIIDDGSTKKISDIVTRWTLRMTVKILPWQPTARFTGVSIYEVEAADSNGPKGIKVSKQTDYWDSINLLPVPADDKNVGSSSKNNINYAPVHKSIAVSDFLSQLSPEVGNAVAASSSELPYQLLRRGKDYEVRRYPSYVAVQTNYGGRREEAYASLSGFCEGITDPLSPSIIEVNNNNKSSDSKQQQEKQMMWPLSYALPTDSNPKVTHTKKAATFEKQKTTTTTTVIIPERVVAVATFADASTEPVVRRTDSKLRESCRRDGLTITKKDTSLLRFAQYDAVHTMGKRRGEVWIELQDGEHPWSSSS